MTVTTSPGLRAVLRNALTWGVAWGLAGGAIAAPFGLFDPNPAIESLPERLGHALFAGAGWGVRFGVVGTLVGGAFALAIRLGYRGRRLREISPLRFALLGAVVGGAGVPLFLQLMNVLFGDGPIAWDLVSDDAVLCGAFGAVAAAATILLARRADAVTGDDAPVLDAPVLDAGPTRGALDAGAPEPATTTTRARETTR